MTVNGFDKHPEHINRNGRPKGTLSMMTIIKNVLAETAPGERKNNAERLVRAYIESSLEKGDGVAIRDLVDRIDGKALQKIEMSNVLDAEWLSIFKDVHDNADEETEGDPDALREEPPEDTDT